MCVYCVHVCMCVCVCVCGCVHVCLLNSVRCNVCGLKSMHAVNCNVISAGGCVVRIEQVCGLKIVWCSVCV